MFSMPPSKLIPIIIWSKFGMFSTNYTLKIPEKSTVLFICIELIARVEQTLDDDGFQRRRKIIWEQLRESILSCFVDVI